MAACPQAPARYRWPGLGLWLPAGGALGCLAAPADRQPTPLCALSSAWVEVSPRARLVRVKSINGTHGRQI